MREQDEHCAGRQRERNVLHTVDIIRVLVLAVVVAVEVVVAATASQSRAVAIVLHRRPPLHRIRSESDGLRRS